MLSRQSRLIAILNEELEKNKKFIDKYKTTITDSVVDNKLLKSLQENPENIVDTTDESINKIISLFSISDHEKRNLQRNVEVIRNILEINKEEQTTIPLEESQKQYLKEFITNLEILNKVREKSIPIDEPEYENAIISSKRIQELLDKLNDKHNIKVIDNIDLVKEILEKSELTEKKKRQIIISLMKYNREIYLETTKKELITKYLGEELDEEELATTFKKYGYDYYLLPEKVQESIRQYGEIKNINEVLDCLNGFKYPKLDEQIYGNTIFALVVGSTFETINNCTINASNKGFKPEDLLKIPGALIRQKKSRVIYRKMKKMDEHTVSIQLDKIEKDPNFLVEKEIAFELLNGRSVDFITNIEYLEDNGFDIMYIFEKCKHLLVLDSKKLVTNLSLFEKYGFPLDCSRERITNQTFAALLSNNLAEVADQFLEIHPLGYKYIRDNMSCLKEYSNPLDIVFYNIYESQKPFVARNGQPMLANAFKEIKSGDYTTIQLCDEITRKYGEYLNTPYRNITEENKLEKTDTFIPTFKNESEYDSIVENNYCDIEDTIFDNEYIKKFEKYTNNNNPLLYNFDGIRISKLKVLRIFGLLLSKGVKPTHESILYSISYNTIMSERSYAKLNNIIMKELGEL